MLKFYDLLPPPEELLDKEISRIASFLMELACAFESEYSEHIKRHDKKEMEHEKWLYNHATSLKRDKDDTDTF